MRRRFRSCGARALAAVSFFLAGASAAGAGERLLLDVYGLSYHPDRNGVHEQHLDNQLNPGLGLKVELREDARGVAFAEAGFYKDSGRHWTAMAGPGYQLKIAEGWRAGAVLYFFDSRTYNHGRPFIAPIPMLTWDLGRFQLNAVYAPRVRDINEFAAFGFFASVPFP